MLLAECQPGMRVRIDYFGDLKSETGVIFFKSEEMGTVYVMLADGRGRTVLPDILTRLQPPQKR